MARTIQILRDDSRSFKLNLEGIPQTIVDKVLKPESELHARDLVAYTFPRKAIQGRRVIERGIRKIFISERSPLFRSVRRRRIKKRLREVVGQPKAVAAILGNVFPKLSGGRPFPIEEASRFGVNKYRRFAGRSNGHVVRQGTPSVSSESAIRATRDELYREVGGAKKGWLFRGVRAPAWVRAARGPMGSREIVTDGTNTLITLTNPERAMVDIERREGVADYVVLLRAKRVRAKLEWEVANKLRNG